MLRKLVATGIVFAIGYTVGVIFGFRAAVVDYVEEDAEKLESMAEDIYPSPEEGAQTGEQELPGIVQDAIEDANTSRRGSEASDGSKGFQ